MIFLLLCVGFIFIIAIDLIFLLYYGTIDKLFMNDYILFKNWTFFANKIARNNRPIYRFFLAILYLFTMILLFFDIIYFISRFLISFFNYFAEIGYNIITE